MGLFDALIYGLRTVLEAGVEKPLRSTINLIGATVFDNVAADRLDVTITGTGILPKLTLVDQASAAAPTAGATVLGSSAGVLSIVSPVGVVRTFEAATGIASKRQVSEVIGAPVRTTGVATTTLLTVPIPAMSVIEFELTIVGLKSDGTMAAWLHRVVRVARGSGSPFGASAMAPSVVADDIPGGTSISGSLTGSALALTLTSPASATIDWIASARVVTFTP